MKLSWSVTRVEIKIVIPRGSRNQSQLAIRSSERGLTKTKTHEAFREVAEGANQEAIQVV